MKKFILLWLAILASVAAILVVGASSATPVRAQQALTDTLAPAATDTPLPAPTDTPIPAATDTPLPPPPTNTPLPAATDTPIPAPTNTPVPAATSTPIPQPSPTPTSFFFFPTRTRFPTRTPFPTPTQFFFPTPTSTVFTFPTATPVVFSTPTALATPTVTPSLAAVYNPPTAVPPTVDPVLLKALKAGTIINLNPPSNVGPGTPFTLTGTLRDWSGGPVPNAGVSFTLNGSYLGQTRTDNTGSFSQKFTKPLDAGIYTIAAAFSGTHLLLASTAATTLTVSPTEVTIQTVPPIAGVTFQLNGSQFVTGPDGSASIKVNQAGTYKLEALVSLFNDPTQKIQFGRWLEDNFQPYSTVTVPTKGVIPVGLNIFNLVGQQFVDLDGLPVDSQRIAQFTIRSEQGDTFVFNDGTPRWIPSSRITRQANGLIVTKLLYSVVNVKVDGSNVVNEAQQQFYAEPSDIWKISLLLYSLQINVSDGLFGSSLGKTVNLLFPDGQVNSYPLNPDGKVEIHGLARGNYTIQVVGTKGIGTKIPVALSRNQTASVKILTYTDLGIVGALGFLVALALLIFGRRSILISTLRKRQRTIRRADNAVLLTDDIQPAEPQGPSPRDEPIKWS